MPTCQCWQLAALPGRPPDGALDAELRTYGIPSRKATRSQGTTALHATHPHQASHTSLPGLNQKRVYRSVLVGWGSMRPRLHSPDRNNTARPRSLHDTHQSWLPVVWFEGVHCVRACTAFLSLSLQSFSPRVFSEPTALSIPQARHFYMDLLVGAPLNPSYLPQAAPRHRQLYHQEIKTRIMNHQR